MRQKSYLHFEQFTTNFTPESSYVLGLLFADGHINKKNNEIRISCLKEDIDVYEPAFQKTGQWNRYNNYTKQRTRNNKPQGVLICTNKNIHNILLESSDFLLSKIPDNLKHYWYRGYIDGDGCWTFRKSSRILPSGTLNTFYTRKFVCTGPLSQDWSFMTDLCKNLSLHYNINQYNKSNHFSQITITGRDNFNKLGNYIYQNWQEDEVGLPRKYKKWQDLVNSYT